MGLPTSLWRVLYDKLTGDVFDAGSLMELQYDEGYQIVPIDDVEHNVFLVDHAWLFQFSEARKQLAALPQLIDRFWSMMVSAITKIS